MKAIPGLLLALFNIPVLSWTQAPALVTIGFEEGKVCYANALNLSENTLMVEILQSGSRYEFDREGFILTSTGKYKPGERVNLIDVTPKKESIYHLEALRTTDGRVPMQIGVQFGDGKIYYGVVEASPRPLWFSIRFLHTGSQYTMHKQFGEWKVFAARKGSYPPGHVLTDIFSLGESKFFYSSH